MNATVNVVCYTSKILSNGEHPLMLRICKDGKKKYTCPDLNLMSLTVSLMNTDFPFGVMQFG